MLRQSKPHHSRPHKTNPLQKQPQQIRPQQTRLLPNHTPQKRPLSRQQQPLGQLRMLMRPQIP